MVKWGGPGVPEIGKLALTPTENTSGFPLWKGWFLLFRTAMQVIGTGHEAHGRSMARGSFLYSPFAVAGTRNKTLCHQGAYRLAGNTNNNQDK